MPVNGNTIYYRKQESERHLGVIRPSDYVMLTKCLSILPCGEFHLTHSCRDLCLADTALLPSLTNNSSSSFKAPCASPGAQWECLALLGCSGRALAGAQCPCSPRCRATLAACGFLLMLSLCLSGKDAPCERGRVQHLHCSGQHTARAAQVITCRWLSCVVSRPVTTCSSRAGPSPTQRGFKHN